MPPKVGGKRVSSAAPSSAGSSARKKKTTVDQSWANLPEITESRLFRPPPRKICVHAKLLQISLLDDVFLFHADATIDAVANRLVAHHGGAIRRDSIEMYATNTQPTNRIRDFSLTLKDVFGLDDARPATVPHPNVPSASGTGAPLVLSPDDHHVIINYDFKSLDSDCPLLNRSPRYKTGNLDSLVGGGGSASMGGSVARSAVAAATSGSSPGTSSVAGTGAGGAAAGGAAGAGATDKSGTQSSVSLAAPLQASGDGASVGVGGGGSSAAGK